MQNPIVVVMDITTLSRDPHGARVVPASGTSTAPLGGGGTPTRPASRVQRLWRGPTDEPSWARPALLALLVATAAFYLYNLTASGWANSFYSAAVQAGSANWEAFLFGSSDAANSITVDKPPASLWVMALSVKLLGLSSFAILAPQVLMGVASVGVLYATVRRHFGAAAGLIAGATLALTPAAVLMFRFNNPDALLTLLMVLGAWATVRAVDKASVRWFMLVGVFIGFAFLTKTLEAFLVVPGFALAYLVAAKATFGRRVAHVLLGGVAIVVSAGWWVALIELIPASMRPYVGGSQTNSFLELTFGYNGFGRITGNETGSVGGGGTSTGRWGATGLTRLFSSEIGGQTSWLIPAALILLVVGLVLRGRRPRTDNRRAAYLVWGSWLAVTMLTFSLMAGIFHAYYTIALAPAGAALVGMGAAEAWQRRVKAIGNLTLAVATAVTSVWGFLLLSRSTDWNSWLRVVVLAVGLAAALGFLVLNRLHARAVPVVIGAALFASLLGPAAYSVQTVSTGHSGSIVDVGPTVAGGAGGRPGGGGFGGGQRGGMGGLLDASTPSTAVVSALSANADKYTWVAAAIGSQNAAGLQLGTQLPVMAIGGFNGSDPSPTLAQFQAYVSAGQIHYFLAGGGIGGGNTGGSNASSKISTWVQSNFTAVTIGGSTFYDLTQPLISTSGSTTATTAATTAATTTATV
ncbi:MAG: glycosyltransferase family 39 protein [Actinomycetota bacterium]|nr:glycosyltransferase family 39 protein [Actinomycetota bacterium]